LISHPHSSHVALGCFPLHHFFTTWSLEGSDDIRTMQGVLGHVSAEATIHAHLLNNHPSMSKTLVGSFPEDLPFIGRSAYERQQAGSGWIREELWSILNWHGTWASWPPMKAEDGPYKL
jgi:hypothetical protein